MLLGAALLCALREPHPGSQGLASTPRIASLTGRPCCCSPCCSSACPWWRAAPSASCWPTLPGRQPGVWRWSRGAAPVAGEPGSPPERAAVPDRLRPGPAGTRPHVHPGHLPGRRAAARPPLTGALLATLALFLPGFLLLWALGPCWQHWLAPPSGGAVAGINAAVVGLLLAALYQPVWQSAVLSPPIWRWPPSASTCCGCHGSPFCPSPPC